MAEPHVESRPLVPDGATPRVEFDETLMRAIEAGRLDPAQAADPRLAGAFAAHQKLESLFALLRGRPADGFCRERTPWRSEGPLWRSADEPPPERLGRYLVVQPPSAGAVHASIGRQVRTAEGGCATVLGAGAFGTVYLAHGKRGLSRRRWLSWASSSGFSVAGRHPRGYGSRARPDRKLNRSRPRFGRRS